MRTRLIPLLLVCAPIAAAQTPAPSRPATPTTPAAPSPPAFRGFAAGVTYREFAQRARTLQAASDKPMVCNTARRTAQLMECGVLLKDPADGAQFYLAAHFTDGRAGLISFGDSGTTARVDALQRELRARFGAPASTGQGLWEWRYAKGRQMVRFNWRGRGASRLMYVTLTDMDVMDRVGQYVPKKPQN